MEKKQKDTLHTTKKVRSHKSRFSKAGVLWFQES